MASPAAHLLPGPEERARLLAVSRGEASPELVVRGAWIADVYGEGWFQANLEVALGRIAYVGPRPPRVGEGTRVLEAEGLYLAPGYLEPHAHPWVLYTPLSLLEALVPQGVTGVVYDDLLLRLHLGPEGTRAFQEWMAEQDLPARVFWAARLAPQTALPEEKLWPEEASLEAPWTLASAEVTAWPRVVGGERGLLTGIARAQALGRRSEAHGAGASFPRLAALAAAGLEADHEALNAQEVLERLRLGFWVMLRHSSLRPDLPNLLRDLPPSPRLMLTTDGASPRFYARGGYPLLLKAALEAGLSPLEALRLATLNPATFLGLDRLLGGLAPGRLADFLLLEAPDRFRPLRVFVGGKEVAREGRMAVPFPPWPLGPRPLPFRDPEVFGDPGRYRLDHRLGLRLESAVITRPAEPSPGALAAFWVNPEGGRRVGAWVAGLMPGLEGLATTFTTAPGLLVLGRNPGAMAWAAREVARMGGGFAAVHGGRVVWRAPLSLFGLMAEGGFDGALAVEEDLWAWTRKWGYPFHDVLYTLLFLTCDFLPDLRLTPMGVLEVKEGRILLPPEPFA